MIADDFPLYRYLGRATRVVDGDTLHIMRDAGFSLYQDVEIRLLGINAPEMHKPTRAAGEAARDYLASLVMGKQLYLITEQDHRSFTRYVARVWTEEDGVLVSVEGRMTASGHAVVYTP